MAKSEGQRYILAMKGEVAHCVSVRRVRSFFAALPWPSLSNTSFFIDRSAKIFRERFSWTRCVGPTRDSAGAQRPRERNGKIWMYI